MDRLFLVLLGFVPATAVAYFLHASPVLVFILSAIAIIPLAKYIGTATEELASQSGSAVGGLLNATFGNATELLIGIFALRAGLLEVVKASITGSILGNLLLVLGLAMFAGGLGRAKQTFNITAAKASASTLLLAAIALVVPALFVLTAPAAGFPIVEELSLTIALLMIISYGASLWFSLRTHKHLYTEDEALHTPKWSRKKSILILLGATVLVAWMSEILVGSIEPLIRVFGWTELFIGVIIIAIVGNAAEHASAVTVAMKNRMDLALQISIGSATQIVMLVAPLLIFASIFLGHPMSLVFNFFEVAALIFSVFIVNSIIDDGESNWFEGLQLLVAYLILAVAFFFYP
ncbi:MAG: calcium/proton exchanger [bacterium]